MKKFSAPLLPVLLGIGGLLLRLLQRRTVFESSGLARPHLLSVMMLVYLVVSAVMFLTLAWQPEREEPHFQETFVLPGGQPPVEFVCAALLYVVSGAFRVAGAVGGGDLIPLVFGALSAVTGIALLLSLRTWRAGECPDRLLLAPVIFSLLWLLVTYREYASYPVTTEFYVPVLAQAAVVYGFYCVSSYAYDGGSDRPTWFILPMGVTLSLTALADGKSLPDLGLYLASALALLTFYRCAQRTEAEGSGEPSEGAEAAEDGEA